ncbi:hypothetical protein D3C81_1584920 [compost metagenome]
MHMNIAFALLTDRGLALRGAALGRVIVANVEFHAGRKGQQFMNRVEQLMGVSAGKVAARGAAIGHEQRVAHQNLFAVDQVGHVRRRMPGHMQGRSLEIADPE